MQHSVRHSAAQQQVVAIPAPRGAAVRPGVLLVELMIALMLITVIASVLPVALNAIYNQRQQERFERTAQLELSNLAAQMHQPGDVVKDPQSSQLSAWFLKLYPDAELQVTEAGPTESDPTTVAVTLAIVHPWDDPHPPLRQALTTWLIQEDTTL